MNLLHFLHKKKTTDTIGLYLKPDGIAYAQLHLDKTQPQICSCHAISTERPEEQQQTLLNIVRSSQTQGLDCVVALAPNYVDMVHLSMPNVEPAEIPSAIRWQLQDKIEIDPQTAMVDYFNMPGPQDTVSEHIYAVAAAAHVIKEKLALVKPSGLNLQKIDIAELAIHHVAQCLDEATEGLAMIHLFKDQGLLQITQNKTLYLTRRLNIGIEHFEQAPQQQRALDGLVLEIQRSLDFYESHFKKAPIQSIALPPLAHMIPSLSSYVSTQLALHAWILDLNERFHCDSMIEEHVQIECIPAIGAALNRWPTR